MPHGSVLYTDYPYYTHSPLNDKWDLETNFYDDEYIIPVLTGESRLPLDYMDSWCMSPTASQKTLAFSTDDLSRDGNDLWMQKPVRLWDSKDIRFWIISVASKQGYNHEDICLPSFRGDDGRVLCSLSESEFVSRDPVYGKILFLELQQLLGSTREAALHKDQLPSFMTFQSPGKSDAPTFYELQDIKVKREIKLEVESNVSVPDRLPKPEDFLKVKRKPGRPPGITRPKRKSEKKCGRLWEFIRDLLLNPEYCPSLICWEDHDNGVFRFVRSEKVADLWGTIKENPKMTYEKLSRAMRYYYKSKVLQPVFGRRLVYKFGPTAKGWRTPNPNFKLPCVSNVS